MTDLETALVTLAGAEAVALVALGLHAIGVMDERDCWSELYHRLMVESDAEKSKLSARLEKIRQALKD